ncbi:nuclear transport factor 2 family protein [Parvibaculum sp.]|jgi:ketosteroid isomerase-like protein|uniref:nuclear transport factor 2 family protein n=1 Tax=Parvibaculum sp. TaxID=2024848 RepID=UPI000C3C624B|nr:nuclear transport factor 2 family protein [Parvibaculum sp.]MAM94285.1 hypothetical protein [Parvibaculum sp.]HCX67813.1 hypothetical protein [Rhodobiaceae bacterium]
MDLPSMVAAWRAAWQSLDPDRVAALYASGATHMSNAVVKRVNRPDGILTGPAEIRAYAAAVAKQIGSFRADITNVIANEETDGGSAAVEYRRIIDGNEREQMRVVEILEWRDGKITACRVFHF